VAYTGGTAYLGKDEESCLFFPHGDEAMCAYQLERILTDHNLAEGLSSKARAITSARNNPETIVINQLKIYRNVIEEKSGT
jgi:glycosyltransferase involved in cell wall biosynthesis